MATTSSRQDREFADKLFGDLEDEIIGELKGIFARDSSWVLDWVAEEFEPSDVFEDEQLEAWAETNGYEKETL